MKIQGVIKNLYFFKKFKIDNSKNISRNFSGGVVGMWGQFSFRQFLVPAYTSSQGHGPPPMLSQF